MATGNPTGRPPNVPWRHDQLQHGPEPGSAGVALKDADLFFQTGGEDGQLMPYKGAMTRAYHGPAYNEDYAASAIEALRSGMTLREHCTMQRKLDPKYPEPQVIYAWAIDNINGFALKYAQARRLCLQHWAEEIMEIADNGSNDWMDRRRQDGTITQVVNHECVQRSKLRIDTRRWLLAKLVPGEYGDRIMHQQLGAHGQPVDPPSAVSPIDLSVELRGWKPRD